MKAGTTARSEGRFSYVLKVTLSEIKPPIWRRFQIPGHYTLGDLHEVLQIAMGWQNAHLHSFYVGGIEYSDPTFAGDGIEFKDEDHTTLESLLPGEGFKFRYVYDFGDDWNHVIAVEAVTPLEQIPEEEYGRVVCLKGKRACPPEDCGSVGGYYSLLDAFHNPESPENQELIEWAGNYDPDWFNIEDVNLRLQDC